MVLYSGETSAVKPQKCGEENTRAARPEPTLCRRLENDPVVLHLKVSWRSCPGVRSGLCHWNNMQVMPFQSPARTA